MNKTLHQSLFPRIIIYSQKEFLYLVPESSVQQVEHSVLLTAHIQIDGQPGLPLFAKDLFSIFGIGKTKIIPTTASPLQL